ncbi:DUF4215 domain-containing protein [Myxococcota bacterium]|nr:DUF4215 domain-containing protein [Myxococcota bacterium]MBU1410024.1 DUF4215 domain-containing protein [Myxococcota bacterium]MBU1510102.1 DUF4215 domain-containing protein [Myxococcota bacterium]
MFKIIRNLLFLVTVSFLLASCAGNTSSGTAFCGDGKVEGSEECDPPGSGACDSLCMRDISKCGNGSCEVPEDEGNCPADCTSTGAVCGNDVIEGTEFCDTTKLGGATCISLGYATGTLACASNCQYDTVNCAQAAECGNGALDTGENCDGEDLNSQTCQTLGLGSGVLSCTDACVFDVSRCSACGNNQIDTGEQCDTDQLGAMTCEQLGFAGGTLTCGGDCQYDTRNCALASCGNGTVESGENCDGNDLNSQTCVTQGFTSGTLSCNPDCSINTGACTSCGNGAIETGEQCDGTNIGTGTCAGQGFTGGTLTCNANCTFNTAGCTRCGNGTVETGEDCDGASMAGHTCVTEGFASGTLTCNTNCTLNPTGCSMCGNGVINGGEQCDGTNLGVGTCQNQGFTAGLLSCNTNCTFNTAGCTLCGNGSIESGEQCEGSNLGGATCTSLGFTSGSLACGSNCLYNTSACYMQTCGNGTIEGSEQCDGSNLNSQTCVSRGFAAGSLSCTNCLFNTAGCTMCGNNIIDSGEQCDGSNLNGQTCVSQGYTGGTLSCSGCAFNTSGCTTSTCGNGSIGTAEECDDANLLLWDGCNDTCQVEDTYYLPLRLSGGPGSNEGRIEVYQGGTWGIVCDDTYVTANQQNLANVVCRQLGFTGTGHTFIGSAGGTYGSGTGVFIMDDVMCTGTEETLAQCPFLGWRQHNCSTGETLGLRCVAAEGDLRLVAGPHGMEGRMQIYHSGAWGEVCDDYWEAGTFNLPYNKYGPDAACQQMGYKRGTSLGYGVYPAPTDTFVLDDVRCAGTEFRMVNCPHGAWSTENCSASEAIGLSCSIYVAGDIRLVDGLTRNHGRVEILHNNLWGTVCDDNLEGVGTAQTNFLNVACRQLNYNTTGTFDLNATGGEDPISMDNVSCTGAEAGLSACTFGGWNVHNCTHGEDSGVTCTP